MVRTPLRIGDVDLLADPLSPGLRRRSDDLSVRAVLPRFAEMESNTAAWARHAGRTKEMAIATRRHPARSSLR